MPKSKRAKTFNLTQVSKKTREHKDKLFTNIRDAVPNYSYCFVFAIDNMRNTHLKEFRQELDDSRIFFGKTKLMARALGTTPEEAHADGIHALSPYLTGLVGLLLTNRDPTSVLTTLSSISGADFSRAGTIAPREFSVPPGPVYATGGEVPAEHDVPFPHSLEPELRRLGMPTRLVKGRVVLGAGNTGDEEVAKAEGEAYVVCKEGDVLDARQTRLLRLFSVCLAEFKIRALAYWSAESGEVKVVDGEDAMEG